MSALPEAQIVVNAGLWRQISENIGNHAILETSIKRQLPRLRRRFAKMLSGVEPGPVVHPFVWSYNQAANMRARRWYFWALKQGLIPTDGTSYKRTGAMIAAFNVQVAFDDLGGLLSVTNDTRAHLYTMGERQVPGHIVTGWPNQEDLNAKFEAEANDIIGETFLTAVDPFAGVPQE